MEHLAAKGWVCVAVNYRLAPRDRWPAQIIDVKQAIAWIQRQHRGLRRRPRLHRDHRRLGRRPPHLARGADRPTTRPSSRASRTSTPSVQAAVPHYGVYDLAGVERAAPRRADARPVPRQAGLRPALLRSARGLRGRLTAAAGHARRPRLLRAARHATTRWSESTRPAQFVAQLRETRSGPSSTPSCPAPSTRSTCSPRSGPRTSCAPSTATCTGTGTPGAGSALPRASALARQAEDPLADDVAQDLGGAARDRQAAGVEHLPDRGLRVGVAVDRADPRPRRPAARRRAPRTS